MPTDQKLELLRRVPLFAGCTTKDLEQIVSLLDEVDLPAGKVLAREGDLGHEFFIVVEGSLGVEEGGQARPSLGPGDFAGEIALLDGGRRTATVTVAENARLLVLATREFHTLLGRSDTIRSEVLRALGERLRRLAGAEAG